jgi:magnesium chelatase subunit I
LFFPNPESTKKKRNSQASNQPENPYRPIQQWFDAGNQLELSNDLKDQQKIQALYQVDGLYALVKKTYKTSNEKETALLMEFVLHGLASFSLISKKTLENSISFKDLMGSMLIFGISSLEDFGFEEDL